MKKRSYHLCSVNMICFFNQSSNDNGFPYGCEDEEFPWDRDGEFLETKYPYVVHAELNAILNSIQDLHGCTLYVSLFPCNECAKAIIQAGISCVVYESDKYDGTEGNIASKRMFHEAGVKLVQLPYEIDVETKMVIRNQIGSTKSWLQELQG